MKYIFIILLFSMINTNVFGQTSPIYHIISKNNYITPKINPTDDSVIDNLHKYINLCRLNTVKVAEKIKLNLSEYPKTLPPLERSVVLDKEAQRTCIRKFIVVNY